MPRPDIESVRKSLPRGITLENVDVDEKFPKGGANFKKSVHNCGMFAHIANLKFLLLQVDEEEPAPAAEEEAVDKEA